MRASWVPTNNGLHGVFEAGLMEAHSKIRVSSLADYFIWTIRTYFDIEHNVLCMMRIILLTFSA